ncbi:MAG: type II secretion system protein GspN [Pseudomonadota bacterium]|nr:type II secretion system protein GspN [Pseudomonadota bacterium]
MIQKLLLGLAALMWGGITFLLGLYVTFPAETARERVVYEFGEWTRGEYALGIGDLALWRLSGVDLDDVTFYTVKKGRKTKDEPAPPPVRQPMLHLDGLAVRAAPLAMLMGKDALAFVAEIYGGALSGQFAQSEAGVEVSFDGGDIDLGRLPVATDQMTLNLLGIASGEADLSFDASDVKNSTGFLKLSFEGLGLGPESAVGGFGLPEVTFGKAGVSFEVKDGKMEVTEGTFESDTLNATLTGDIVLNKKLVRSRNRLELLFSLPEDLDKLAQIAPELKRSRDEDGKYHLAIGGTILAPSVRFSKSGAVGRAGRSAMDGGPLLGEDGPGIQPDFQPSADPEERRKAREERIRERRARLKERREAANANGGSSPDDRGSPDLGEKNPDMEEFDPGVGEDGPEHPPQQFPPDGPLDGPFDPQMDGPMDDGPPPEFEE